MPSIFRMEDGQGAAPRARLLLCLLSALLALFLGFVTVGIGPASWMIRYLGYYFILGVVILFVYSAWRLHVQDGSSFRSLVGKHKAGLCAVILCSLFVLCMDRLAYKVLFDEYVLQATAQNLHLTKEVGALVRGYELSGSYVPLDVMMDKRPYLQAFLISLVHDFTGYRQINIFVLNALMVPVLLGLVYYTGRKLSNERGGISAVVVFSTLPLLGQVATGAGMEMLNLTLLALTLCAAIRYVNEPGEERLSFLCLCAVLLSQCRYESVLFALPVALCVLWGWYRQKRVILPWVAILTPLLFVPYAWHNRIVAANPTLWQLNEGQSSRFSLQYLHTNLEGFRDYFFQPGSHLASSPLLSFSGVIALVLAPWALRSGRTGEDRSSLRVYWLFAAFVAGNLALLMFYYWARLDDPVASRFALPLCFVLAVLVGTVAGRLLGASRRLWLASLGLVAVYVMAVLRPAIAHGYYSELNQTARLIEWEVEYVRSMPPLPRLVIANRSTLPFTVEERPAINFPTFNVSLEKLRFHLAAKTFEELIVLQTLRPSTESGDYYVDPEDRLPAGCVIEVLAEKRFGGTLHRISRLRLPESPAAPVRDGVALQ